MADVLPKPKISERVGKFVRDLFTEKDGLSWDFVRVFGALSIVWFMGNVSFSVFKGQTFNPESVAIGLATLLSAVAGGVAVRAWSKSENT